MRKNSYYPVCERIWLRRCLRKKSRKESKDSGDIDVRSYDMVEADAEKVNEELFVCGRNIAWNSYDCRRSAQADMGSYLQCFRLLTEENMPAHSEATVGAEKECRNITQRLKQLKMKVSEGFRVRFKPSEADLVSAYEYGYQFGCIVQNKRTCKAEEKRRQNACENVLPAEKFSILRSRYVRCAESEKRIL